MTRHIVIFAACFLVAALVTTALRVARYQPHAGHPAPVVGTGVHAEPASPAAKDEVPPQAASAKPVNSICPICGMKVDPSIPPALWQGKVIGFGCRMCPPKFAAAPDKFGAAALKNQIVED